jgi:hypothetical protein
MLLLSSLFLFFPCPPWKAPKESMAPCIMVHNPCPHPPRSANTGDTWIPRISIGKYQEFQGWYTRTVEFLDASLALISPRREVEWTRFDQSAGHVKPFNWSRKHCLYVLIILTWWIMLSLSPPTTECQHGRYLNSEDLRRKVSGIPRMVYSNSRFSIMNASFVLGLFPYYE